MSRRLSHPASGSANSGPQNNAAPLPLPESRRRRLLGLLVGDLTNPFFPELIHAFEDLATRHGYEILLGSTGYDTERTRRSIRRLLDLHVDGAAILTFGSEGPLRAEIVRELGALPLVFIDEAPRAPRACALTVDYRHGFGEAIRHLANLGHRKIAYISGPMGLRSARLRREVFLAAIEEEDCVCRESWLIEGNHTMESGMHAMEHILSQKALPTAVVCSNDMMALGAKRELDRRGIDVPGSMSIVGFDDVLFAEFATPPLTTIRMSRKALAGAAVEALRSEIELPGQPIPKILLKLPTSLIVRQSTGFAPRNGSRAEAQAAVSIANARSARA
ncbi:MAG: substrate-binding domain-containing protein [Acidobacteriaceae bacterium]